MTVPVGLPLGKPAVWERFKESWEQKKLQSKALQSCSALRLNSVLPNHCAESQLLTGEAKEPERLLSHSRTMQAGRQSQDCAALSAEQESVHLRRPKHHQTALRFTTRAVNSRQTFPYPEGNDPSLKQEKESFPSEI